MILIFNSFLFLVTVVVLGCMLAIVLGAVREFSLFYAFSIMELCSKY